MKHNYNVFSKQELVAFLSKYEDNFLCLDNPFDMMLNVKLDELMRQIHSVNQESGELNTSFETMEDKLQYLSEIQKINSRWQKLDKEYDRLSKLRFGK